MAVDGNFSRTKLYSKSESALGKHGTYPLANLYAVSVK